MAKEKTNKDFSDGGRKRQEMDELRERRALSRVNGLFSAAQKDRLAAHLLRSLLFYGVDADAVPSSVTAVTPPLGVMREWVNLWARKICISVCA